MSMSLGALGAGVAAYAVKTLATKFATKLGNEAAEKISDTITDKNKGAKPEAAKPNTSITNIHIDVNMPESHDLYDQIQEQLVKSTMKQYSPGTQTAWETGLPDGIELGWTTGTPEDAKLKDSA